MCYLKDCWVSDEWGTRLRCKKLVMVRQESFVQNPWHRPVMCYPNAIFTPTFQNQQWN